ncbi:MAG: hydroxyacylglutathione hydrolase family protein [Nitrososphaeria archaeon]|nr:hydroxyacylglutathione hydrolase family protein [Nitrososphaeria archaeon]
MLFKQIKAVGDNFTYVIADTSAREAAVVDPSFNIKPIIKILEENRLRLKYIICTHHHFDHTAEVDFLKTRFGAKIVAHKVSDIDKDIGVEDGSIVEVGSIKINVIHTPGHTEDSICLLFDNKLLTGDTLFVGGCGRTDLPGGNAEKLYQSLYNKILKLDDSIEIYPGHDYGSSPSSTIGLEKSFNPALKQKGMDDFLTFINAP